MANNYVLFLLTTEVDAAAKSYATFTKAIPLSSPLLSFPHIISPFAMQFACSSNPFSSTPDSKGYNFANK